MKSIQDKFSTQAQTYKKYRPTYPKELYALLLDLVEKKGTCWDCGTGNGQVAIELAKHFHQVYATDISQDQLDQAKQKENINYQLTRAEQTPFSDQQFDLITVAQAMHWFDFQAFYREVRRVGKEGGILSIWGYGLLRIEPKINELIDHFYHEVIGIYWNEERKHIDQAYNSIHFDFEQIPMKEDLFINIHWSIEQLEGYFNSWSSVQNFKKVHPEIDPVAPTIAAIEKYWKVGEEKAVRFPIFMKVGRIG
ncbi:MAG: class I SAM-dependent methyltransferase [Bacteroidota bacterium]